MSILNRLERRHVIPAILTLASISLLASSCRTSTKKEESTIATLGDGCVPNGANFATLINQVYQQKNVSINRYPPNNSIKIFSGEEYRSAAPQTWSYLRTFITVGYSDINKYGSMSLEEIDKLGGSAKDTARRAKESWNKMMETYQAMRAKYPESFSQETYVFRGMTVTNEQLETYLQASMQRRAFHLGPNGKQSWTSTSRSRSTAKTYTETGSGYKIFFAIKQKSGMSVESIATYIKEAEVLIPPHAQFKITGVAPMAEDHRTIIFQLQEI